MLAAYPTTYKDSRGTEETVMYNDGSILSMRLRDVDFSGYGWTSLEAAITTSEVDLAQFEFAVLRTLNGPCKSRDLTNCEITSVVPIAVVWEGYDRVESMRVRYDLSKDDGLGGPWIQMASIDPDYESDGGGTFEYGMLRLQQRMPENSYFKCCFGCAFASYDPYGDQEIGMKCYRNHKQGYVATDHEKQFVLTHDPAELVQDLYLCPEFERWNGHSGYRDAIVSRRPAAPPTTPTSTNA